MDRSRKKITPEHSAVVRPRSVSRQQMFSVVHAGNWFPAADVYETPSAIIVHIDISGMDPQALSVVADGTKITISGERGYSPQEMVSGIHQLEIERGYYERSIALPKAVDVAKAVSETKNGFLQITLPLRCNPGKIKIPVR